MADSSRGALILVGTPIGNLDDLSPRAVRALGEADAIACEDTRRTGRLLNHFAIAAPKLLVANEHTERRVAADIVARVRAGERVVVVSDAGMPGICDPGEVMVQTLLAAKLAVEVVPGPSALDTALVISGLPTGRFCFEGFLPRKGSGRAERLRAVANETRTVVLYEAPHRLERTLGDLCAACGDNRPIAMVRELTKLHEEHWRGTLAEAVVSVGDREPRGEYVLVLAGAAPDGEVDDETLLDELESQRMTGASTRDAVAAVVARYQVPHRRVYALATSRTRPDDR